MKISRLDAAVNQKLLEKLQSLRNDYTISALTGDYKSYKTSVKEFAALANRNRDLLDILPKQKINVPLFSKEGFSMLKIWFFNLFRSKTPAEKELRKYSREIQLRNKYL